MRRRLLPILVSLAGVCLIALLIYGVSAQPASRTLDEAIAQGRHPTAPQAQRSLPVLSGDAGSSPAAAGRSGSLASFRGKLVILNFWASWCQPCRAEAPLLEHAQGTLEKHDGTVLGVSYLDASGDSQAFMREQHITYPSLRDTTGEFAHAYGTDQLPESFVIDRAGKIVAISRGEIDHGFLDAAIKLAEGAA